MDADRRSSRRKRLQLRRKSTKKSVSTAARQNPESTTARRSSFASRKCLAWILGLGLWVNSSNAYICHHSNAITRHVVMTASLSKPMPSLSSSSNSQNEDDSVILDPKFLQRNKCWVVLVDDEEAIRQSVGDFLYDEGYSVTACDGADSLIKLLTDNSNGNGKNNQDSLPSVIVSDVRMPGMDGITLVQTLRQDARYQKIPIVLLTAKAMTMDRISGFKAGADAYLPKPFHPDELLSILDNTSVRRKQIQEARRGTLAELKDEMNTIKSIMKQNSAQTVQKTTVYLTPAERDVLELICQGFTNKEIAQERSVTVDRVVKMVKKMLSTTKTKNRTELVRWAFQTGYVSPSRR